MVVLLTCKNEEDPIKKMKALEGNETIHRFFHILKGS